MVSGEELGTEQALRKCLLNVGSKCLLSTNIFTNGLERQECRCSVPTPKAACVGKVGTVSLPMDLVMSQNSVVDSKRQTLNLRSGQRLTDNSIQFSQ